MAQRVRDLVREYMSYTLALLLVMLLGGISQATELTIGLIPERNVFEQKAKYRPLQEYVAKKTGFKINLTMLSRYGNIIDSFTEGKLDGAFWGSFTGAMAIKKLRVEPIARPVEPDGTSTYHGYIFVKQSSRITNVAAMRGKTVAFVEKATTAGYVFPVAYFRENGVKDLDTYFKEYFFTGSHDAAIRAVLDGKADIGAARNTIYDLLTRQDPRVKKDLMILAESPKVPSNGLGMRKTIDAAIKGRLKDVLLGMDRETDGQVVLRQFGAIRFIKTVTEDYNPVFEIARKAGIDVERYSYVNK